MSLSSIEDQTVAPQPVHVPVLLPQTLELLAPKPGGILVDATLGPGGHAEALLEAVGPQGRVVGVDRDLEAIRFARGRLERFGEAFLPLHGNHRDLIRLLRESGVFAVDGILFDLGISSMQLDAPERGFSFQADGPLDMRMDPDGGSTAAEILATSDEAELRRILWSYGEERRAGAIARAVVEQREREPLTRTGQLAALVQRVLGPAAKRFRIHPATRTFQALRIAVNRELDDLERVVTESVSILRRGARLAVIAYHSLEDRAVKVAMRSLAQRCVCPPRLPVCGCGRENLLRVLTSKPVRPSAEEVARNPRARSARLRAGERL